MSSRVEAIINHELLIWARESIGFDIENAAKKIGVKPERLRQWENREKKPTVNQLRKISQVYKRPLAVFYLPEVPKSFSPMKNFRTLPEAEAKPYSPNLRLEIDLAIKRHSLALEMANEIGEELRNIEASAQLSDDPESVAETARELIGVSHEQQVRWNTPYVAFREWRSGIERLDILVFQTDNVSVEEKRGFLIYNNLLPSIVINGKERPYGKIFTLLHEFSHFLLNRGGLCVEGNDSKSAALHRQAEVFCNHAAGAILIPKRQLLEEPLVLEKKPQETWKDDELNLLSKKYSVSPEAILRRMLILGKTTSGFYAAKRDEFLQRRMREEFKRGNSGFFPYYRRIVRNLGHSYIKLGLNAYYNEKLTTSELSEYLGGINLKYVPKIEKEVIGRSLAFGNV